VNETVDETLDSMDLQIDKTFHESMYAMEDGEAAAKLSDRKERVKNSPREWGKSRVRAAEKYASKNPSAPKSMATQAAEVSASADSRQSRLEMETYLKNAVGRDVVVMTGAEATGYGEMQYGDESSKQGITVCVTLGKTIGVSLFDDGVLAHNPRDVERQVATWDYPRWDDAPLPRPVLQEGDVAPLDEEWDRWAARVEHYLSRIEAVCKPDNFIICGRASVSYDKWAHKMRGIETPVRCAKQGLNAAVQGAAQGAREILTLRRDTARVRAAIGHQKGLSPQKLTDDMLGAVFDEFDVDGSGALSSEELAVAISRLGVTMTDAELKELFVEMDSEMTGDIRRHEFINWWKDSIGSSSVEIIHTMEEYQQVMEDAAGTGQLTVLMVGVTYCKPCKAFSKKYGDFAERFSDARFIKVFGNENKDMTTLCRDELKVKSTPTFYFFRDDEQVHMHTGANAGKFEKFILENSRPGEPGYGSPRLFEDPVEDPKKDSKDKKEAPAR
jgi:thioredoxin 1